MVIGLQRSDPVQKCFQSSHFIVAQQIMRLHLFEAFCKTIKDIPAKGVLKTIELERKMIERALMRKRIRSVTPALKHGFYTRQKGAEVVFSDFLELGTLVNRTNLPRTCIRLDQEPQTADSKSRRATNCKLQNLIR
jgi:hypothetical protein